MVVVHATYEWELQVMENAIGKNAVYTSKIMSDINLAGSYDTKFVLFNEDIYHAEAIPAVPVA